MPADSLKDEIRKMNGEKSEQKKTKIEIDTLLAEADRCYCQSTDEKEHRKSYDIYSNLYASGVTDAVMLQRLGYFHYNGYLVTRNMIKGIKFYERAAQLGDGTSNVFLGNLYENGEGVEKNISLAMYYYEKGGEFGNLECLYRMGELYRQGENVSQNNYLAMVYHERAIEKGYVNSYVPLSMIYNDIAKSQNQFGRQYYEEKAFGYAYVGYKEKIFGAAGCLALAYAFGKGVGHNYELAIKYNEEAIAEYENANVPASIICDMKSFHKKLEEQNRQEKALLYGRNEKIKARHYNFWESMSEEFRKFLIFVTLSLVSYLILELGGSVLFSIVYVISGIVAIKYLIVFIVMTVKEWFVL